MTHAVRKPSGGLLLAGLALASNAPCAAAPAPEAELIQREQDYARALINRDLAFLRDYYAPDWRGGDWKGVASKTNILNMVKASRYVIRSMKLHDLNLRIFGDIAIVQGMDEEVSSFAGKDVSGNWGWTDVFQRRAGRWVCIASQTTKIERGGR
jgi:hypothetical protein